MEIPEKLLNMRQAAIRLNRIGNERLLKFLVIESHIPFGQVGRSIVIDEKDFPRLAQALRDYESRPTISGKPRRSTRKDCTPVTMS